MYPKIAARFRGGVLADPRFRRYFLSRAVSVVGDAAVPTALTLSIIQAGFSAARLGIILAAALVPRAILVVPAGVIADRFPKRRLLILSSLACGLAQTATAPLLMWGADFRWTVAFQVLYGAAASVAYPAAFGYLPFCVEPGSLNAANSVLSAWTGAAYLIGPSVTALCTFLGSPALALLVDAASFFLGAVLLIGLPAGIPSRGHARGRSALREGWTTLRQLPWLIRITVVDGLVLLLVVAPVMVLGPELLRHYARHGWVIMMLVFAAGELAGGLGAGRLRLRRPLVGAALGLLSLGLPPLLLGLGAALPALCVAELLAGIGITVFGVLVNTLVQQSAPRDHLAKVGALSSVGSFALLPLGYVLAPALGSLIGIRTVMYAAAGWTIIGVAILLTHAGLRQAHTTTTTARDVSAHIAVESARDAG